MSELAEPNQGGDAVPDGADTPRTLLFCTSYAETDFDWNTRYRIWLGAALQSGVEFDFILIADDSSPLLPGWPEWRVIHDVVEAPPPAVQVPPRKLLCQFKNHLGK